MLRAVYLGEGLLLREAMGTEGILRSLGGGEGGNEEVDLAKLEGLAKEMIPGDKGEMSWLYNKKRKLGGRTELIQWKS